MTRDDGGAAFPWVAKNDSGGFVDVGGVKVPPMTTAVAGGMTLRDYFAAKAIPIAWNGALDGDIPDGIGSLCSTTAELAYRIADAMLAARKR